MNFIDLQNKIIDWVISDHFELTPSEQLAQFIGLLNDMGLQIIRANVEVNHLHPQVDILVYKWQAENNPFLIVPSDYLLKSTVHDFQEGFVGEAVYCHGIKRGEIYKNSPMNMRMEQERVSRYHRIDNEQTEFEFPVLQDLQRMGARGYLVVPVTTCMGKVEKISFATGKADGFSQQEIRFLETQGAILMRVLEPSMMAMITRSLLRNYLGEATGQKVFEGSIIRGDVERIDSVVWYSDLRNFTGLSKTLETKELISMLNEYYSAMNKVISDCNGEILKFIGDAILAIFPIGNNTNAFHDSFCAALKAKRALTVLNEQLHLRNLPELNHGIALHNGSVEYGNIGAENRLDFTVIGDAVNMTSRIEGLCKTLDEDILLSESTAKMLSGKTQFKGRYELKGFVGEQNLYVPVS